MVGITLAYAGLAGLRALDQHRTNGWQLILSFVDVGPTKLPTKCHRWPNKWMLSGKGLDRGDIREALDGVWNNLQIRQSWHQWFSVTLVCKLFIEQKTMHLHCKKSTQVFIKVLCWFHYSFFINDILSTISDQTHDCLQVIILYS